MSEAHRLFNERCFGELRNYAEELDRENAALRAMSDKADTSTRKGPRYQTLIQNAARKAQS